mgnify:CR=1 FL=1
MSVFADSSAVVKLYVDEHDSDLIREHPVLIVSAIARVEVVSAIWRKVVDGDLPLRDAETILSQFEADFAGNQASRLAAVSVGEVVLKLATRMVRVHSLRTLDALQLASALAVREADPECREFASFDRKLNDSASRQGFAVITSS